MHIRSGLTQSSTYLLKAAIDFNSREPSEEMAILCAQYFISHISGETSCCVKYERGVAPILYKLCTYLPVKLQLRPSVTLTSGASKLKQAWSYAPNRVIL